MAMQLCMRLQVWYFGPNIGHAILGLEPSGCTYLAGEAAACIYPSVMNHPVQGCTFGSAKSETIISLIARTA